MKDKCKITQCECCGWKTNCESSWKFEHEGKTYYEDISEHIDDEVWDTEPIVLKYGEAFRNSIEAGEECCRVCKSINIFIVE